MKKVNRITEGAILLSVYCILFLLFLYIPVVNLVAPLFLALPFMIFSARNEWKLASVLLIGSIVLSFIFGSFFGIATAFTYGTMGILVGELLKRGKSRISLFIGGSLVFLVNTVLQYVVAVAFFQIDFIQEMLLMLDESLATSFSMIGSLGQKAQLEQIETQIQSSISMLKILIPSLFALSSMLAVFVIQAVSFPIMKRIGIKVPIWLPFRNWQLPKSIVWYYLITLLITLLVKPEEGTYLYTAVLNLSFILQVFIMIQGLSLVYYFFHLKKGSKVIPIIITVLLFFIPFLLYIIRILGIMDLGFDIRKRLRKKQ